MQPITSLLSVLLLVVPSIAWMDSPYGNNNFNSRVEYGQNVTLVCEDSSRIPAFDSVEYWIRPDLVVMTADYMEGFSTVDGTATWRVSSDGKEMKASLLSAEHFGFYYCVVKVDNENLIIKKGINYNGPYFGNLWPKYRMNVIIGLSAAGVFLFLSVLFIVIVAFCKKGDGEEDEADSTAGNGVHDLQHAMRQKSTDEDSEVDRHQYTSASANENSDKYEEVRL